MITGGMEEAADETVVRDTAGGPRGSRSGLACPESGKPDYPSGAPNSHQRATVDKNLESYTGTKWDAERL